MPDYETLRLIWWGLIAVLLIGFAVMDGFDLGVGAQLFAIGRSDEERRVLINTVGPVWDGNQVWLILAGGAIFAAFPLVYAAAFSGFYVALLMVLFALFFRPVGFDYRSKLENRAWRLFWDIGLTIGGAVPALVFGIAFGNLLQGVPFHFDDTMRSFYTGGILDMLNPFALLAGVVSLSMLLMHGASWLIVKTEGRLQARAETSLRVSGIVLLAAFAVAGWWIATGIEGYRIVGHIDPNAPSNPLLKQVARETGAWLTNFNQHPALWLAPAMTFIGAALAMIVGKRRPIVSFLGSASAVTGVIATCGIAMFPFVMPSSSTPSHSLTIWDASSSQSTLWLMLIATAIFMPIIIAYTSWVYRVLRGKVTEQDIRENSHAMY